MKKNNCTYLFTQLAILVVPPLLVTVVFPVNNTADAIETFAGYSCGVAGLVIRYFIMIFVGAGDTVPSIVFLVVNTLLYAGIFTVCMVSNRFLKSTILINAVLVVWKILFGVVWMNAAMQ